MRHFWAAVVVVLQAGGAAAADAGTADSAPAALIKRINVLRQTPHACGPERTSRTPPLRPVEALTRIPAGQARTQGSLQDDLRAAGYAAARSALLSLSGPPDDAAAMLLLVARYCSTLSSERYSDVGVARSGHDWRVVLAEPLLAPDLGSSQSAGQRVLALVNGARSSPRQCGDRRMPAAPPVIWSAVLAETAQAHSDDMAARSDVSHTGHDGQQVAERATQRGYLWRAIAENIAAGQGSSERVTAAWLDSPGHCVNLMDARFTEMGAAYTVRNDSASTIYWTQVLGARSRASPNRGALLGRPPPPRRSGDSPP